MPKFKYEWTVEEKATDTRVWKIRSNKKLRRTDLIELACNTEEHPGEGYIEDGSEAIFEEIIYGDTEWSFTLNNTNKEDNNE